MMRRLPTVSHARIAQPEPWMVSATLVKCSRNLSKEPEELVYCCCQLAGGLVATLGGQVVPEDGVVGVATQVERQVLGELGDVAVCTVLACLFELLESCVSACNVCCVVLVVVQLHDLCGDVGLERRVVVGELGEGVLSAMMMPFIRMLGLY